MWGFEILVLVWFLVRFTDAELDYVSKGQGMYLSGDHIIAGMFPLFKSSDDTNGQPALEPCNKGAPNKHGFHLMQAMRFAVEQINNSSLLPGVTLGYQIYDICSLPASILATLDLLLPQQEEGEAEVNRSESRESVAVIGPDSSSKSFTPAAFLGSNLMPQISYEASNELLSNKNLYPSFFRTIPSDKNQVAAMIQLLVHFNWTWIALLGSDNDYGLQGMHSLAKQAPYYGICIAYQGIIPTASDKTAQQMRNMVDGILTTKVNTIVAFSSKSKLSGFMPFVIEKNVTNKVWIGTEDWSVATLISSIPGAHTIGTVIGISVKNADVQGFAEFEKRDVEKSMQYNGGKNGESLENVCLQSTDLYSMAINDYSLETYDRTSSFNVYKAVYAVAHALRRLLECDSRNCSNRTVQPWELLTWLKRVRFSVDNTSVYFDQNGDPPTGYDIVTWIWRGTAWSLRLVGSFSPDPVSLVINEDLIEWHNTGAEDMMTQVPLSICSPPCPTGYKKILSGQHSCCFDCQACPAAHFFNKSDPTECQPCPAAKWAPEKSEHCLDRTVLLLTWDNPLTIALLFFMACCLFMTVSSAIILLVYITTPVAKSAGGRTCLVMLAALTLAALSSLCHFGPPSQIACLLKHPLFIFSFTVCLAAITVRAFQVVCIFKFASKLPPIYDRWAKNNGPEWTIFIVSFAILVISVLRVAVDPPKPSKDFAFYYHSIVLECSNTLSVGSVVEVAYVSILSMLCFFLSYLGKDLPANYNEAKCVTFSLMVYMISWISFFTLYLISRGPFTVAAHVFAILFSVLAFYGGYFLPKIYIIMFKPELNTTAHFQNCIQMYTMSKQ
ncbi:taste receptor type 1 member 1 [Boleophthalmus pectinirostris]|uniref:taste receptor type 1 member 1 n=1 Tax=Boleophthalmus pectinirostris TaxID=150288 RepID=UPI00242D4437|nr:taste receptor type 1 member 1 [Boleophthalmus pectinirostris]